jgi:hypothetical protein
VVTNPTFLRYLDYLTHFPPTLKDDDRTFRNLVGQLRSKFDRGNPDALQVYRLAQIQASRLERVRRFCADKIAGQNNGLLREAKLLPLYPALID